METFVTNSQFKVMLGSEEYGFAKVANLSKTLEYDSIAEGGRNWSPLLFRKAKAQMDVMTLERGVRTERNKDVKSGIRTGTLIKGGIILVQMDHRTYRKYTFDEGVVTKLKLSDLNALGNEVLIETMDIAHSGLYEIKVSG